MIEVSVIVPCYNLEKYISDCLDSLVSQTFKSYEVIVIDDGSTDSSVNIIQKYVDKYPFIRLLKQENQGVVTARNNAISQAKGTYIYNLDGDDVVSEDAIEKSYLAIVSKKGDIIASQNCDFKDIKNIQLPKKYKFKKPTKFNMLNCCCIMNSAMYKKSDFELVGGYDVRFNKGWEDYDFWLNMIVNHNLKIYRINEFLFFNRVKDKEESRNENAKSFSKDLNAVLYEKYPQIKCVRLIHKILNVKKLIYQKKVTSKGNLVIKIFKIPVYKTKVAK